MAEPRISWDHGTAYDLFASLYVIHAPADFGLRASWAAGIRSRLSAESRDFLAITALYMNIPAAWLLSLPQPKPARAVLDALEAMPARGIFPTLASDPASQEPCELLLRKVMTEGRWQEEDLDAYRSCMGPMHAKGPAAERDALARWLDSWAQPERAGETFRHGLREFYEVFYREEERRIQPDLDRALERDRERAARSSAAELFEQLSRGIRVEYHLKQEELVMVPCWWCTPRILYTNVAPGRQVVLYGARPATASLVPGDAVPGDLLLALEALSDPTRLAILNTLTVEPLTQADIARRLRLRPPTISHHLKSLRIAGLIAYLGTGAGETRYGVRAAQVNQTCEQLKAFLGV